MKHLILTTILFINVLGYYLNAQKIISEDYTQNYLHEDFNDASKYFKTVTTSDNYFIFDNGDYLLSRNNKQSEYAIIATNSNVSDFILKTSIRIGPSNNKKASLGMILKAQKDGKGAVIFELNKEGEYRVKKLMGNEYKALSSNNKQQGWVKNKLINKVDEHNSIEIRSENNIYDVYINNTYLTTFFVPDFSSGSCGIIITPETKARVAYFHINTKETKLIENHEIKHTNITTEENPITNDIQTENISKLKDENSILTTKNNKQQEEIKNLNRKIDQLKIENKNIWGDFELESQNITKLQQINIKHQDNLENKQQEINELNQKVNLKKGEITNLKQDNNNLTAITTKQETKIKLLQNSVDDLRVAENKSSMHNKTLTNEIAQLEGNISIEKTKNTQLTNDLNNAVKSSNKTIKEINTKIIELKGKLEKLTTSKKELETDLIASKNEHQQIKNSLSKSISNKKQEITNLENEIKNLNTELSSLKSKQLTFDWEMREQKEKHRQDIKTLNSTITTMNTTISETNNKLDTAYARNTALQLKNNELKELFILKDFEMNGVKPSEITTKNTTVTKIVKGNETIIYSVQFGVYMQKQSYKSMRNIDHVWNENTEQGTFIYYSGEFTSSEEATLHMHSLIAKGYKNAFVVTLTK